MPIPTEVFGYSDYKVYLKALISSHTGPKKGIQTRFAEAASCQPAYVSHVLNGKADLSPDQALSISDYLRHSEEESDYFLNLVHWARASSPRLKERLKNENRRLLERKNDLSKKIKSPILTEQAVLNTYYSQWVYSAVHMALAIPRLRTPANLSQALGIEFSVLNKALSFLEEAKLIRLETNGQYTRTQANLHISPDSPTVGQHHINWKLKCISRINEADRSDFHYTSVATLHRDDLPKLKQAMAEAVEKIRGTIKESSPDEVLIAYQLDLFKLS